METSAKIIHDLIIRGNRGQSQNKKRKSSGSASAWIMMFIQYAVWYSRLQSEWSAACRKGSAVCPDAATCNLFDAVSGWCRFALMPPAFDWALRGQIYHDSCVIPPVFLVPVSVAVHVFLP
jgi:hypothetical protein